MQTPPCPACGTPLRWFPEMNAWGCDRCRQMMPAAPQPMQGAPARAGRSHAPQTKAEKTRTLILLGLLVVASGIVIAMLATDKKGGEIDCEAYVEKSVALATAGRTGADLEEMTRRVRMLAETSCANGEVTDQEAECVAQSPTHDALLQCMGLGGGGGGK